MMIILSIILLTFAGILSILAGQLIGRDINIW